MLKLIGITFAVLFCSIILREKAPMFAVAISVVGIFIVLLIALSQANELMNELNELSSLIKSSAAYIKLMIKVLLITILTQILTDVCRDNGENALASVTEISAKLIIIGLVIPIFKTIISIVLGFIK